MSKLGVMTRDDQDAKPRHTINRQIADNSLISLKKLVILTERSMTSSCPISSSMGTATVADSLQQHNTIQLQGSNLNSIDSYYKKLLKH